MTRGDGATWLKYILPILAVTGLLLLLPITVVADDITSTATVSLVTSNVTSSRPGCHSVIIQWETNDNATSQVFYDLYPHENINDYAYSTSENTALTANHWIYLSGLARGMTYHYRVRSEIPETDSLAISDDHTFTTLHSCSNPSNAYYRYYYLEVNQFGKDRVYRVSKSGEVLEPIEFTSNDERFVLTIPKGTLALDDRGKRLEYIEAKLCEDLPMLPPNCDLIGQAYCLGPDGAQFDPPIQITLAYDSDDLPNDVEDKDLVIGCCDEINSEWPLLQSEVNADYKTLTADVEHFTAFAILGFSTLINSSDQPHTPDLVTFQPEPSEPSEVGQLPQQTTQGPSMQPSREAITPTPASETTEEVNWAILGPIIGVAAFAIVFFPVRLMTRKRRR